MHVLSNLRMLIRCLQFVGQLSIQNHAEEDGLFRSTRHATSKFVLSFTVSVLACSYLMHCSIDDYDKLSVNGIIWPLVYVVHNATFFAVFCALPWQTYRHRDRLAAALNTLRQNELSLIDLTGSVTDYRVVKLLAVVIVCNTVCFHIIFQVYYITKTHSPDELFLSVYIVDCTFMYFDVVIELVLGLCDCLLLIAHLQLERLVWIVKNRDQAAMSIDRVLLTYVTTYNSIAAVLGDHLCSYFGPLVLLHCSYTCLEAAICILDTNRHIINIDGIMSIVANILWPLSDLKKLSAVFLLGEGVNRMVEETALCTRHFDDYRLQNTRAAKQIQNFLLKNLHQKKKFSACGFFDIDNTVIYMVFSSIVTYLVILIQFKQLETDLTQAGDGYNVTSNVSTVQP
ncbi:AGAP009805-PG [Anopheles gambiae str. PEST]|uniref:Gustatory receptor n=1 Tax=Anopheles gambiae TaxID=7165 RepID=A7UV45_ANOGA|nr:AGAP009805-PG [Anopheles gambiae str. PEST]